MVGLASALVLNIGTLSEHWIEAMLLAGRAASARGIPVVLDPVGAGATAYRTDTARRILDEVHVTVLRGNAGEVATLVGADAEVRGVESIATGLEPAELAVEAGRQLGLVASVTGPVDHVSDGRRTLAVANGHPLLAAVTGTGCISSALTGCFLAAKPEEPLEAAAEALAALGVAAEDAADGAAGPGTFHARLYDALAALDPETLDGRARVSEFDDARGGRRVRAARRARAAGTGPGNRARRRGRRRARRDAGCAHRGRPLPLRPSGLARARRACCGRQHQRPRRLGSRSARSPRLARAAAGDRARGGAGALRRPERARRAGARRRHDPRRPRPPVRDRARPLGARAGPRGSKARGRRRPHRAARRRGSRVSHRLIAAGAGPRRAGQAPRSGGDRDARRLGRARARRRTHRGALRASASRSSSSASPSPRARSSTTSASARTTSCSRPRPIRSTSR